MVAPAVSGGVKNPEAVLPVAGGWFGAIAVPPSLFRVAVPYPFSVFFPEKFGKKNEKNAQKNGLFAESVFGI